MPPLRGSGPHLPLTRHEYNALYWRARTSSRKEAATARGISDTSERHALAAAFHKLGVTTILEAFRTMGWLNPLTWNEYQDQDPYTIDDPRPMSWPPEEGT